MNKYDKVMMDTAIKFSELSSCNRSKVGAVLVRDSRIINSGYNGTISGSCNECEEWIACPDCNLLDRNCSTCNNHKFIRTTIKSVVHAEQNVITNCAKHGIPTNGCSIYVTLSPCIDCAKLLIQSGIVEVIYKDEYRITDGLDLLRFNNIVVRRLDE